jgi:hypothetical protein
MPLTVANNIFFISVVRPGWNFRMTRVESAGLQPGDLPRSQCRLTLGDLLVIFRQRLVGE